MAQQRKLLAFGSLVLVATAAVLVLARLFPSSEDSIKGESSPSRRAGKRSIGARGEAGSMELVAVVPTTIGRTSSLPGRPDCITKRPADPSVAAIIWLRLPKTKLPISGVSVVDDLGRELEAIGPAIVNDLAYISVSRGYPTDIKRVTIRALFDHGKAETAPLTIAAGKLPASSRVLNPPSQTEPSIRVGRLKNTPNTLLVEISMAKGQTNIIEVRAVRSTFADYSEKATSLAWTAIKRSSQGLFEGQVYLPNPKLANEVELEVVDLGQELSTGEVEFTSAGLTPLTVHRSIKFPNPETRPGPAGATFTLTGFEAEPAARTAKKSYWGYLYADLQFNAKPNAIEQEFGLLPGASGVILAPPASAIGVRDADYAIRFGKEERITDPPRPSRTDPNPPKPTKPGSIVARVVVSHAKELAKRKVVVGIEPGEMSQPHFTSRT
jgi:hypothetical protein